MDRNSPKYDQFMLGRESRTNFLVKSQYNMHPYALIILVHIWIHGTANILQESLNPEAKVSASSISRF